VNTITLLTDFGPRDPYVGIMKGVMLSINPQVRLVDIIHEIDPQDIREAAFLIREFYRWFPRHTVHLCVVDPTVGSERKAVVVVKEDHLFVGPDNGLFTLIYDPTCVVYEIANRRFMLKEVSGTFHGRDVFAPAAAFLSVGLNPDDFGPRVSDPVMLSDLSPAVEGDVMRGEIIRFDRFGNAISTIHIDRFREFVADSPFHIEVKGLSFRSLSRSYYEGEHTCVVGSSGYLEFGLFKGNFRTSWGLEKGERVSVRRAGEGAKQEVEKMRS
jgi:S-adenosyl-L-methionine hydrolase (adenosine-forming)